MTDVIKEFLVELGFSVDENSLKKFNKGLQDAGKSLAKIGAAAVASAALMAKFVETTAASFNSLQLLSERVNASANDILKLGFAADVSGSSLDAVKRSFDGLTRSAGEAAVGIGRGAAAFKQLNINARESNGTMKSTAQLMSEIGDKIRDLSNQEQVAILAKLGIDPTLVRTLTEDISGLNREFESIYRNVGIDANKAALSSEAFVDSVSRLSFVFGALKDSVALEFMPRIKREIDNLRKFLIQNSPAIIKSISPIVETMLNISKAVIVGSGRLIEQFSKLNKATDGWAGGILAAGVAFKVLNLAFLATPIGRLITLASTIGILIDDFSVFRAGGDSLIDWANAFDNSLRFLLDSSTKLRESLTSLLKVFFKFSAKHAQTFGNNALNPFSSVAALIPSPAKSDSSQSTNQNVSQNTSITVNGASSPNQTAKAISGQQTRVNADLFRNFSGLFQ